MVETHEGFGERRSKLWRIIGAESPFLQRDSLIKTIEDPQVPAMSDLLQRAIRLHKEERYYEAEETYKKALTVSDSSAVRNNYAVLLNILARYVEADTHFKRALTLHPTDSLIFQNYVDHLIHIDLMERAEEYAKQWVTVHPKKTQVWRKYAFILAYQGKFDQAEEKFKQYEELTTCKNTCIHEDPFRSNENIKFAIRLAFLGSQRAKKYVKNAEYTEMFHPQADGLVLTLLGEYDKAEQVFTEEMRNFSVKPDLRVAYSSLLEKQGKLEKAEAVLRKEIRDLPEEETTLSHMANLLLLTGKDEEAWKYHKKALERNPRNALVHFSYAQFLVRKAEDKANRHFLRALELAPRSPEIHLAYGRYLTGIGRDTMAGYHLRRAANLNPLDSIIHLSLARFFKLRGETGKSEVHRRKAFSLNSEAVKDHYWWF